MKLIEINDPSKLDEFMETSAMTFEGINLENTDGLAELLKMCGNKKRNNKGFIFKGYLMNNHYELTGDNRYSNHLNFLVIPNFWNVQFKLLTGARWFDDIVQNNADRESEMKLEMDN